MTLRSVALSTVVLPLAEWLTPTRFWSLYRDMVRLDAGPRAGRLAVQRERLAALLRHAGAIPYWQAALNGAGAPVSEANCLETLRTLPFTTKSTLRTHFKALIAPDRDREALRYNNSSGTTERVTIVSDFDKRDFLRASEVRALHQTTGLPIGGRIVEVPPDACNILCGVRDPAPQALIAFAWYSLKNGQLFSRATRSDFLGRFDRGIIHGKLVLPPIDPAVPETLGTALDAALRTAVEAEPSSLRGFPQYLLWLAEHAAARQVRLPGLRAVLPYGGMVSRPMGERIGAALGAPFRDLYGTSELGAMAAACAHGYLHPFEDLYHFEVVRGEQQAADGELGELVVTDLTNLAMPIIRYRLGDVAVWLSEPCPCGHDGPRLLIHGRRQDLLRRPAQPPVTARDLEDLFYADAGVWNFRIDERQRGEYTAFVVPAPGKTPDAAALTEGFKALMGADVPLKIRARPFLKPEASGKYRAAHPQDNGEAPWT